MPDRVANDLVSPALLSLALWRIWQNCCTSSSDKTGLKVNKNNLLIGISKLKDCLTCAVYTDWPE